MSLSLNTIERFQPQHTTTQLRLRFFLPAIPLTYRYRITMARTECHSHGIERLTHGIRAPLTRLRGFWITFFAILSARKFTRDRQSQTNRQALRYKGIGE